MNEKDFVDQIIDAMWYDSLHKAFCIARIKIELEHLDKMLKITENTVKLIENRELGE